MKIAGIIAEYNPFHTGHEYHISRCRQLTGADFVIVFMSGNFVQRGAPAIIDKYSRAKAALLAGADLVFEMPCVYATSSAQNFARAGISFFEQSGVTDFLCFGAENASVDELFSAAELLHLQTDEFKFLLSRFLKLGHSYPKAVSLCAQELLKNNSIQTTDIFSSPNNILAIEYLRAILDLKSELKPVALSRKGSYHSADLSGQFCSASAIRSVLEKDGDPSRIINFLTRDTAALLTSSLNRTFPVTANDLSPIFNYVLASESFEHLKEYAGMTDELARRLYKHKLELKSFSDWGEFLKTKNITRSHIDRALLHVILNNVKKDEPVCFNRSLIPYAYLLGFRKEAACVLKQMKHCGNLPIIAKTANAKKILSKEANALFEKDLYASEIYRRLVFEKFGTVMPNEFQRQIICL